MTSHRIETHAHQQPTSSKTTGSSGEKAPDSFHGSGSSRLGAPQHPTAAATLRKEDAKQAEQTAAHDAAASARGQDADQTVAEKLAEQKKAREARKEKNKELFKKLPEELKKTLGGQHLNVEDKEKFAEDFPIIGKYRSEERQHSNHSKETPIGDYIMGLREEQSLLKNEQALQETNLEQGLDALNDKIYSLEEELEENRTTERSDSDKKIDQMPGISGAMARGLRGISNLVSWVVDTVQNAADRIISVRTSEQIQAGNERIKEIQTSEFRNIENDLQKAKQERDSLRLQLSKVRGDLKSIEILTASQFKNLHSVDTVISQTENVNSDVTQLVERLKNGTLRARVGAQALTESEAELARILGGDTGLTLQRISADQAELKAHLETLAQEQKEVERVLKEVEELRKKHPGDKHLDAKRTKLLELQTQFEPQTRLATQGLNLLERMKRCKVLEDLTAARDSTQRKINQRTRLLEHLKKVTRDYNSAPTKEQLNFEENNLGPTLENCEGQQKLYTKELLELSEYAKKIDRIFEDQLVELQRQDEDPNRNKLPIDGWTPWLLDLARNAMKTDSGRRLGTQPVAMLVHAKLWADQGATLGSAYDALTKSLQSMLSWNDPKRVAQELARLAQLPEWILKNPELVREFVMNIRLTLTTLSQGSNSTGSLAQLAEQVRDIIVTDDWVNDLLVGNRETRSEGISPEGLALLHLTNWMPAFMSATQAKDSNLGSALGTIMGTPGNWLGDRISGFFSGTLRAVLTKTVAQAMPANTGKFLEAATAVQKGTDIKQAGADVLQRIALRESVGFARDVSTLGFKNALKESWIDFKSWWSKSNWKEKTVRTFAQIVPAIAGVAAGIVVVAGSIVTLGIPVLLGGFQLVGKGIAWGFGGMTLANKGIDFFFPDATQQVALERLERRRNERQFQTEVERKEFIASTKQPEVTALKQPATFSESAWNLLWPWSSEQQASTNEVQAPQITASMAAAAAAGSSQGITEAAPTQAAQEVQKTKETIAQHVNQRFDELKELLKVSNVRIVVPGSSEENHALGRGLAVGQWKDKFGDAGENAGKEIVELIKTRLKELRSGPHAKQIIFGNVGDVEESKTYKSGTRTFPVNPEYEAGEHEDGNRYYHVWGANATNWATADSGSGQAHVIAKLSDEKKKYAFGIVTTPLNGVEGILKAENTAATPATHTPPQSLTPVSAVQGPHLYDKERDVSQIQKAYDAEFRGKSMDILTTGRWSGEKAGVGKNATCFYESKNSFGILANTARDVPVKFLKRTHIPYNEHDLEHQKIGFDEYVSNENFFQASKFRYGSPSWEWARNYGSQAGETFGYDKQAGKTFPGKVFDRATSEQGKADLIGNFSPTAPDEKLLNQNMWTAMLAKYTQNESARWALLATQNSLIVENSGDKDNKWGAGQPTTGYGSSKKGIEGKTNGDGENRLGIFLMAMREQLQKTGTITAKIPDYLQEDTTQKTSQQWAEKFGCKKI